MVLRVTGKMSVVKLDEKNLTAMHVEKITHESPLPQKNVLFPVIVLFFI
jgi:hypothetical protein